MVRIAIVGLGNVASALVQGVEYYKQSNEKPIGLLEEIQAISLKELEFVLAFDINKDKVGKDISEAIFVEPNCAVKLFTPKKLGPVLKGPILDGLDSNISMHVPIDKMQKIVNIRDELLKHKIDVVVITIPTGSNDAARFYAKEAIIAGCAVINGMPALIANDSEIVLMAKNNKVPLIGDDVKSQIGATIVHRSISNLFPLRGAILDRTIQLDWGGDMDFCNLTSNNRYEKGKRQSKTESVISHLPNKDTVEVQISAVDYIPFLKNQKEAYTRVEGRIFGGMPVRLDLFMQVQDGYNSAGIIADMIRVAVICRKKDKFGAIIPACAFFNKKPPIQMEDDAAKIALLNIIS